MTYPSEHDLGWWSDPDYDRSGRLIREDESPPEYQCCDCGIEYYAEEMVRCPDGKICRDCAAHREAVTWAAELWRRKRGGEE